MNNPSTTPAVVPEAPEPKAWAFHYHGSVKPTDDRSCELCTAVAMGKCPKLGDPVRHGSPKPDDNEPWLSHCPACHAARMGYCHHHAGIETALAKHTVSGSGAGHVIHPEQKDAWSAAQAHILTLVSGLPAEVKSVRVRAHADQDQPNADFARVVVEVAASK
jgi:hypothetical protein